MAEDKKGFLMYADQREHFDELTDEEAGKLVKHLFAYVNDEDPIAPDTLTKVSFISIKNQLKRDLEKYEDKRGNNSKAGREGNLKRWASDLYDQYKSGEINLEDAEYIAKYRKISPPDKGESPPIAKVAVNVNDSVSDTDSDILLEKETKGDKPPVFVFKKSLLDYGFKKNLVDDFLKNRKTKKLTNTETAYDSFIEEIEKTGREKNEVFKIIVEKGWGGFKASWNLEDEKPKPTNVQILS